MARRIDADALKKAILAEPWKNQNNAVRLTVDYINIIIDEQPTVDAVEVVRCKNCKWAEYGKDYEPYCNHWKSGLYADIKDDDFCSYGERRTDG